MMRSWSRFAKKPKRRKQLKQRKEVKHPDVIAARAHLFAAKTHLRMLGYSKKQALAEVERWFTKGYVVEQPDLISLT